MREKHSALMRPVVFALDHVRSITAAPAETPHETWFQDSYGEGINTALERLRNPSNPANPGSSWVPFKQVSAPPAASAVLSRSPARPGRRATCNWVCRGVPRARRRTLDWSQQTAWYLRGVEEYLCPCASSNL